MKLIRDSSPYALDLTRTFCKQTTNSSRPARSNETVTIFEVPGPVRLIRTNHLIHKPENRILEKIGVVQAAIIERITSARLRITSYSSSTRPRKKRKMHADIKKIVTRVPHSAQRHQCQNTGFFEHAVTALVAPQDYNGI